MSVITVEPTKQDYLVGTEYFCQENRGNELFRALVDQTYEDYERPGATRKTKSTLTEFIFNEIIQAGGRFLIRLPNGTNRTKKVRASFRDIKWVEMSRRDSITQVVSGFRNKRRDLSRKRSKSSISTASPLSGRADDKLILQEIASQKPAQSQEFRMNPVSANKETIIKRNRIDPNDVSERKSGVGDTVPQPRDVSGQLDGPTRTVSAIDGSDDAAGVLNSFQDGPSLSSALSISSCEQSRDSKIGERVCPSCGYVNTHPSKCAVCGAAYAHSRDIAKFCPESTVQCDAHK